MGCTSSVQAISIAATRPEEDQEEDPSAKDRELRAGAPAADAAPQAEAQGGPGMVKPAGATGHESWVAQGSHHFRNRHPEDVKFGCGRDEAEGKHASTLWSRYALKAQHPTGVWPLPYQV